MPIMASKYIKLAILIIINNDVLARDPASEQLVNYNETHKITDVIRTRYGAPVSSIEYSLTAGPTGPLLLQDKVFLDTMSHFDRERIPERVVHAKGAGAFGYFEVTNDITKYTKACVFSAVGKQTRVAVRFSLVTPEKGGPDIIRNPRGFAIKFYSEDGIWDIVGLNGPVFFIRDPIQFPDFIHSQKRNPVTNINDKDMFWDFLLGRPESTYEVLILFSDLGTPKGFRYMNGFGVNTFKMVNKDGKAVYVKFHLKSNQGIQNFTSVEEKELVGSDPDFSTRDLYNSIATKNFPSWNFFIQVMTFQEAEDLPWNPFDDTKIWPEDKFKLIKVGKLTLNENPTNYFADVEQIAFDPGNMIPGIEPSPDKMLQGRLFSYSDTQRYRLGTNYFQLTVNCPFSNRIIRNYQRDGFGTFHNQDGAPNYYPNSFGGPHSSLRDKISNFQVSGDVSRYNTSGDDFFQATDYWNSLTQSQQEHLIQNMAESLKGAAPFLQERAVKTYSNVHSNLGSKLKKLLAKN